MSRVEVKNKLRGIIREMLLSDLDADRQIPEKVVKHILENYGCTISEKSNEKEDLNGFVRHLQKWIEDTHLLLDDSSVKKTEEPDLDLNLVFEKYTEAETEYCEVTTELIKALEEVIKQKETYSQFFKDKCKAQETNVEVLSEKCQILKLNFFFKLYGEDNALKGHLALRAKLKKELDSLKRTLSEVEEYNKNMNEIKNDKTFCELFRLYKELKKIEERAKIIGQM